MVRHRRRLQGGVRQHQGEDPGRVRVQAARRQGGRAGAARPHHSASARQVGGTCDPVGTSLSILAFIPDSATRSPSCLGGRGRWPGLSSPSPPPLPWRCELAFFHLLFFRTLLLLSAGGTSTFLVCGAHQARGLEGEPTICCQDYAETGKGG